MSTLPVPSDSSPGTKAAHAVGAATAVAALLAGDVAMVSVAALARRDVPGVLLQWAATATVITIGSYLLCGVPQLRAWRRSSVAQTAAAVSDFRTRWAVNTLRRGGWVAFGVASVVAGPLAIAWFYGRRGNPLAQPLTRAAAAVFGMVWSAAYLGVLSAAF